MKKNLFLKIAILSVYFVQMGAGAVNPAVASIAKSFPGIPLTTILLVTTLSIVASVPATIISGRIAGSKVKYKTLLVLGMILFTLGGIGPYFTQSSFTMILAFRIVFGIGVGIVIPLGAALIIAFFDGDERNELMGLGGVASNVGGILFQLLGGFAASVSWGYSFLVHGLGIITLVLILFLPEPEKTQEKQSKAKIPGFVYFYAIGIFVVMVLIFPLLVTMSSVIETGGMGNAADSGMVLTMYTIGGMLAGFVFAKLFDILKQNTITVTLFLIAIAMACIAFGNTIVFMYMGATLGGIGIGIITPTIFILLGNKLPSAQVAIASGLIMGFMNVGGFLSAYVYEMLAIVFGQVGNLKFPFYFATGCFAIGAIGMLLIKNVKSVKKVM